MQVARQHDDHRLEGGGLACHLLRPTAGCVGEVSSSPQAVAAIRVVAKMIDRVRIWPLRVLQLARCRLVIQDLRDVLDIVPWQAPFTTSRRGCWPKTFVTPMPTRAVGNGAFAVHLSVIGSYAVTVRSGVSPVLVSRSPRSRIPAPAALLRSHDVLAAADVRLSSSTDSWPDRRLRRSR